MTKPVVFIHGAGEGAYDADHVLARGLQDELGKEYDVTYLKMHDEINAPYTQWKKQLESSLASIKQPSIVVGHSIGASHLAKMLTELPKDVSLAGAFLLETPFWGGEGWHYEGYKDLELPRDSAKKIRNDIKLFIYHTRDDEIAPFEHLALYTKLFPYAVTRELATGGHQMEGDISVVAEDIKNL